MGILAILLMTSIVVLSSGCGGESGGPPPSELGDFCTLDSECREGLCVAHRCSRECTDSAQCAGGTRTLVCGVRETGARVCLPPCGEASGYVCEGGVPVSCAHASTESCSACGCAFQANTYCNEDTDACTPLEPVGQPCKGDDECASDNCSTLTQVCRVAVGSACNASNCDLCRTRTGGSTYCSRECSDKSDCNGGMCVGTSSISLYHCTPQCSPTSTSACPGQCDNLSDFSGYYCACESPECTATFGKGDLGDLCRNDSMCTSGNCWSVVEASGIGVSKSIGFCTTTCTSTAQCGTGFACVNAECNGTSCTAVCLPTCASDGDCRRGTCKGIANVGAAGMTSVCTVRMANGSRCTWDGDCQSANCNQFGNCE